MGHHGRVAKNGKATKLMTQERKEELKQKTVNVVDLFTRSAAVIAMMLSSWMLFTVNSNENDIVKSRGEYISLSADVLVLGKSLDEVSRLYYPIDAANKHEAWALRLAADSRDDRREIKQRMDTIIDLLMNGRRQVLP